MTSLRLVSRDRGQTFAGLVVDVALGLVDVDVDQGVPVGVADPHLLSGDLGDAAAGDTPLHPQRPGRKGPLRAGETHAVQAPAQGWRYRRGQGLHQDAVVDDVRQVDVQP